MLLSPGTTVGPYRVAAKMGEVYRARDTKLDRDVALQVLGQVIVRPLAPQAARHAPPFSSSSEFVTATGETRRSRVTN